MVISAAIFTSIKTLSLAHSIMFNTYTSCCNEAEVTVESSVVSVNAVTSCFLIKFEASIYLDLCPSIFHVNSSILFETAPWMLAVEVFDNFMLTTFANVTLFTIARSSGVCEEEFRWTP